MSEQRKATIGLIIIFALLGLIGWIYRVYRERYEDETLKSTQTKKTWAIYFEDREGKGIIGTRFYYYNQHKKRIEFDRHRYYKNLKFGDTVIIQYSLNDNSVVKILSVKPNYKLLD